MSTKCLARQQMEWVNEEEGWLPHLFLLSPNRNAKLGVVSVIYTPTKLENKQWILVLPAADLRLKLII